MTKVALIGIGGMGFNHFKQYAKMEDVKVIAVADVRIDMAKEKIAGYCDIAYSAPGSAIVPGEETEGGNDNTPEE